MHKEREKNAFFIGLFLLILGIINVIAHIVFDKGFFLIWYCNHIILLAGILIVLKSRYWLNSVINVGFFPVIIWIVDYVAHIITKQSFLGISDYVFEETNRLLFLLYHLHLLIMPLMILALWFLGGALKDSWKGSIIYGLFLFLISLPTDPSYNANCAHRSCILFPEGFIFLAIQQILFVFLFIFTNWLLVKWLNRKN